MLDIPRILEKTFLRHAEHHASIDSTQNRARELAALAARSEIALPALVVADEQTAGRGRGTNRWWTGSGSLAFSVLVDPLAFGFERGAVPRLSLAVGVALVEALANLLSNQPLGLHWPNDVYVGPQKLAGILVEVLPDGLHVIGIGLNSNNSVADAPADIRATITTLADLTGHPHDHTELLIAILDQLAAALELLAAPPELLGSRFDSLCRQRGEVLTVYQGDRQTTGVCAGIGEDGALLLDTDAGRKAVYSGTLKKPQ